jgi:hypothetical protein
LENDRPFESATIASIKQQIIHSKGVLDPVPSLSNLPSEVRGVGG